MRRTIAKIISIYFAFALALMPILPVFANADSNVITNITGSAEYLAAASGPTTMVTDGRTFAIEAMLEKGANICAERNFALKIAAVKADAEMLRFLVENGADIHYDNDRIIRDMAEGDNLSAVKVLAELGADVCAQNDFPLQAAIINENAEMVRYLISKGAGKNNKLST